MQNQNNAQQPQQKKTLNLKVKSLEPKSAPARCCATSPVIGAS